MNIDKKFSDILDHLLGPKLHDHSGDKTICYLIFDMDDIIEVKKKLLQGWIDLATNKGFKVQVLSLHEVLKGFFQEDEYRIEAGELAAEDTYENEEVYASLGENVRNQSIIENAILEAQNQVHNENGVLFITDLEAIHPFTRFGPIEQNIYSEVRVPIVVFYPGEKSGTALKFLGFFPEDGNYRSEHF